MAHLGHTIHTLFCSRKGHCTLHAAPPGTMTGLAAISRMDKNRSATKPMPRPGGTRVTMKHNTQQPCRLPLDEGHCTTNVALNPLDSLRTVATAPAGVGADETTGHDPWDATRRTRALDELTTLARSRERSVFELWEQVRSRYVTRSDANQAREPEQGTTLSDDLADESDSFCLGPEPPVPE